MLFHKSSLRIKNLISPRKPSVEDVSALPSQAFFNQLVDSHSAHVRTQSWDSTTTDDSQPRRDSQATISSNHGAAITACSSSSSLCSCDDHEVPHSSSAAHQPKASNFFIPHSNHFRRRDRVDLHSNNKQYSSLRNFEFPKDGNKPAAAESRLDLFEALTMAPPEHDKTPTQESTVRGAEEQGQVSWQTGLDELIRETDEAFGTVGNALARKESADGWYDVKSKPGSPSASRNRFSVLLTASSRQKKQHKAPVARGKSVSIAKRDKSQKKKPPALMIRTPEPKTKTREERSNSRWTLEEVTENMADIFRFNRMEVDEMLTPGRIKTIEMDKFLHERHTTPPSSDRKASSHDLSSPLTAQTPSSPFHLQDLPVRLRAAGISSKTPPQQPPPPAGGEPFSSPAYVRSIKPDGSIFADDPAETPYAVSPETPWNLDDELELRNFPITPASHTKTHRLTSSLPSIPENRPPQFDLTQTRPARPREFSSPTRPTSHTAETNSVSTAQQQLLHDSSDTSPIKVAHTSLPVPPTSEPVLLRSTPFTLTSPFFQHGPIRLPSARRKRVIPQSPPPTGGKEDQVDWTAFQMAISGGAGDYFMTGTIDHEELANEEKEIDGIVEWWKGFGFKGYGRMVGEKEWGSGGRKVSRGSGTIGRAEGERRRRRQLNGISWLGFERGKTEGILAKAAIRAMNELAPQRLGDVDILEDRRRSGLPERLLAAAPLTETQDSELPRSMQSVRDRRKRDKVLGRKIASLKGKERATYFATSNSLKQKPHNPKSRLPAFLQNLEIEAANSMESEDSLPTSPMEDLTSVAEGTGEPPIPMGFNLDHDLKDFLSWERSHVDPFTTERDGGDEPSPLSSAGDGERSLWYDSDEKKERTGGVS